MDGKQELFVYLDFNGKLTNKLLEKKEVFLRLAKIETNSPLVQLNDSVFQGTYGYSIGTNLFFVEADETKLKSDAFEDQNSITLQHYCTLTKVIDLKPVKLLPKPTTQSDPIQYNEITINLTGDYASMLKKLEDGTLDLKNLDDENTVAESVQTEKIPDELISTDVISQNTLPEIIQNKNILNTKYERLKMLAKRPTKRVVCVESIEENSRLVNHNLEKLFLQPSDYFRVQISKEGALNDQNLGTHVDLDRCKLYGIIGNNTENDLTPTEKARLFSISNIDNLSLEGRLLVLQESIKKLEQGLLQSGKEGQETDRFGRTISDTLRVYKSIATSLENVITWTNNK